ncbi:caspase family protein [Mesorhizobium sp. URHB0026]
MRLDAALAIVFLWLLVGFTAMAEAHDRAMVIGVGQYPGLLGPDGQAGGVNLAGPPIDAQNVASMLVRDLGYREEDVKILIDAQASRATILDTFQTWLIDGTAPGDRVFFYFSGHGAEVSLKSGGKTHLTTGLVPADARSEVSASAARAGGLILGSQLGRLVRKLDGRDITVVADACHSGSLTKDANKGLVSNRAIRTITPNGPIDLDPGEITDDIIQENKTGVRLLDFNVRGGETLPNLAVWSAATIAQYSWDSPSGGIFTNAFVEGLRGRAADTTGSKRVTASALLAYVRDEAKLFCEKNKECTEFTPDLIAPDSYRAKALVPYPSEEPPLADDGAVPPDGPQLVDLAQGVLSHTNDFQIEAEVVPSDRVKLNSSVKFRIKSAEAGQLLVLDTGPDGKLRMIFPNSYSQAANRKGEIRAGVALTIPDERYPFEFTATDPGPGTLMVVAAEKGTDFEAILAGTPALDALTTPVRNLVAIASQLQQPVLDPNPNVPNRARRWAFTTVPYVVEP